MKKIIMSIICVCIAIITIISSIIIYRNSYNTDYESEDIDREYTLYNGKLSIIITPKINIKNFDYYIYFNNSDNKINFSYDFIKAGEKIEHIFYINEIESKYLENEQYKSWSWNITSAKVQNKYKNQERNYIKTSNTECQITFELSSVIKQGHYQNKNYTYEYWNVYCTIKNNTAKDILSIQNYSSSFILQGNMDCEIYIERIDFDKVLKAGETQRINIEDFDLKSKNISQEVVKEQYNNLISSTTINNQYYSIVYQN